MSECLCCICGGVSGGAISAALTSLFYKHNRGRWQCESAANKLGPEELSRARRNAIEKEAAEKDQGTRSAAWLNSFVAVLWPRIDSYVRELLTVTVADKINSKLPGPMKGTLIFKKVELGEAIPSFGPLTIRDRETDLDVPAKISYQDAKKTKQIALDLGVDINTELEISMTVAHIPLGVKRLIIRGMLSVIFQPPAEGPPFFGAIEVYFKNPPQIDLDFIGAANVADCPGLAGFIRSSITEVVASKFVLPNRLAIDMDSNDDVDALSLKFPDPQGILRLVVTSGSDLLARDKPWFGGKPTSDTYVEVIASGAGHFVTPVIKKSVNPVWTQDNSLDVYVFEKGQVINFRVFDEDWGGDDAMGDVKEIPVSALMIPSSGKPLQHSYPVSTKDIPDARAEEQGSLSFSTEWLVFADKGPTEGVTNLVYLSVKIDHAHDIPSAFVPPFVLQAAVTSDPKYKVTSKPSWPAPAAKVASALADVCVNLSASNMSVEDIARATDLTEEDVQVAVSQANDPKEAVRLMAQAAKVRARSRPQFQEGLHLLVPWNGDINFDTPLTLQLVDSKSKIVDSSSTIKIGQIIKGELKDQKRLFLDKKVKVDMEICARWVTHA